MLMPKFSYAALDSRGKETRGVIEVANQNEAIGRIKELGLFPTKVVEVDKNQADAGARTGLKGKGLNRQININIPGLGSGVKAKTLCVFTRQLATLVQAGLPLLRGLRVLQKQERSPALKRIIGQLGQSIEGGSTFSEALAQHPKVFNRLFVNMVKAGEMGGVLEVVLKRLSEFMEKAEKIKGKVIAAMFYPVAVMVVAVAIMAVLMVLVIPKFKEIFEGALGGGQNLPDFTQFVMAISDTIRFHFISTIIGVAVFLVAFNLLVRTRIGRRLFDKFKLIMPAIGPVVSKVAIARFTRTLGTLVSSGVPILQALTIVKETSGNVIIGNAVAAVHESVKEGETITAPLEASGIFPPMVVSMVDVGEQTGALPEMLMKIADNYEEEVDNAVASMTSLLEPIMIVFLAVIVGSIVIAMFLPLIQLMSAIGEDAQQGGKKGD
jgi:type IV pilus assembly protein PilC